MRTFAIIGVLAIGLITQARADIFATGYFTGDIYRFNEQTAARSVFASVGSFSGLAGVAYNPFNNQLYVSAQNLESVFAYNADTGANVGVYNLGFATAGLSVDANGKVYVARFGDDPPTQMNPQPSSAALQVYVYNPDFVAAPQIISANLPVGAAGVGIAPIGAPNAGSAYISSAGFGIYRVPGTSLPSVPNTSVVPSFFANQGPSIGQIAVGLDGRVYAGSAIGAVNDVTIYNTSGAAVGSITVDESLVNTIGGTGGSSPGTSPGGVTVDVNGDIIVAVFGRNNPFETQGQNGGLFKFSPNGGSVPLQTFATDFAALSAVTIGPTAVPEPASVGLLLVASASAMVYNQRRRRRTLDVTVSPPGKMLA